MPSIDQQATHSADRTDVVQDLGWGRILFGQTFADPDSLGEVMRTEGSGRRDICLYLPHPHIFVSQHGQDYFLDPSYTYRLDLTDPPAARHITGVTVREPQDRPDCAAMNRAYVRNRMVPADVDLMWHNQEQEVGVLYFVAVDDATGEVLGTVTGLDHVQLFDDPERGSSLWSLAVDPGCTVPGVGDQLVRHLVRVMAERGCRQLDLSVIHTIDPAIRLYERMGFRQVPIVAVKRKNALNEHLFATTADLDTLNPYARIVADEAIRRGIAVTVLDADSGLLRLDHGGTSIVTRESLSQLTTAIAMSICDDKRLTRSVVSGAGVRVPRAHVATFDPVDHEFLAEVGTAVVKPARGEPGRGITVGVRTDEELDEALVRAGGSETTIVIEEQCPGEDLRVLVIDNQVVAAAIRRPATVVGTGEHTIEDLIVAQSRRRAAATHGESTIPLDELTTATVEEHGRSLTDVLPRGESLQVRRTANLHTGGTIHDVTDEIHPELATAAVTAAQAIGIPVTGIDLMVPDVTRPDYAFIEANERPGLANHEPRPTAEAFIDLLFPRTTAPPRAWQPGRRNDTGSDTSGPGDALGHE
ncbi:MAG: N-acetylglutaminylglutamine synthetase [Propionibacteriaceae bacterium]|nr:N-acetylglutaminylglutamine synthetase [Propionibacteriaceae bacterium]